MHCPCCKVKTTAYGIALHMEDAHSIRDGPNRTFQYTCGWPGCTQKLFGHKNNIREHYFKHTGAKPYKCGDCSLRTNSQSSIYRHYQRRHGRKATTADVLVATTTEAEEAFAEDSATTSSEEGEEVPVAPPAPSKAEEKKSRRHSPYASARQTRQSKSKKKEPRHEEVSTSEGEDFGVMQPLDTNVASTSYASDASTPLASSSTGVEYHYYGAGVVPEPSSVPYAVAGWTYDPYVPLDGPEYPVFVVQEGDVPEYLASPYAPQQPLYADASVIDPTLLAPPYAYAPQRSVSPAESLLSASSIDPYDAYDYAGDDVYQPLIWSSDFTFSPDYDPAYDASLYPPYTFYHH